jgi:predicted neuraminidase
MSPEPLVQVHYKIYNMYRHLILWVILITSAVFSSAQDKLVKTSGELVFSSPPFAQCHASTIVETSPGIFFLAVFGGTGEGNKDVCIWTSEFSKGSWGTPVLAADGITDGNKRYPCWNPVLFKNSADFLFLYYKVGPSPQTWWGMMKRSSDNGKTWSEATRLPEGIIGPVKNKPVVLASGTVVSGSSTETGGNWKVHMELSDDHGFTWKAIPVDISNGYQMIQPAILVHSPEKLQILCRSKSNVIVESFSVDGGRGWSKVTTTKLPNPDSGIDALTLKNGKFMLVYNPLIHGRDDRSKLSIAISDDGQNWKDVFSLEDHEKSEFSYPAIIQSSDGNIHITYTYNRVNIKHQVLSLVN